jgi:hypothetical protein
MGENTKLPSKLLDYWQRIFNKDAKNLHLGEGYFFQIFLYSFSLPGILISNVQCLNALFLFWAYTHTHTSLTFFVL